MKIANELTWVPPEDTQRAKVDTKYRKKKNRKKEKDLHKITKVYCTQSSRGGAGCLLSVEVTLNITSRNFAQRPFEGKFNSSPLILIANRWSNKLQDRGTLTIQWQFTNKELTVYGYIKNYEHLGKK